MKFKKSFFSSTQRKSWQQRKCGKDLCLYNALVILKIFGKMIFFRSLPENQARNEGIVAIFL